MRTRQLALITVLLVILPGLGLGGQTSAGKSERRGAGAREVLARLPLSFEPNQGQIAAPVRFLAHGAGYSLFLTANGSVLTLGQPASGKPTAHAKSSPAPAQSSRRDVVRFNLLGANPHTRITGEDMLPGKSNYFIGNNPQRWHTNVPTYAKVRYHSVYPGVDVVYYGREGKLENDFIVAPGANPDEVRIRMEGARRVRLAQAGELVLTTKAGEVELRHPVAYQGSGSKRRRVAVRYVWLGKDEIGLEAKSYNKSEPLIVDPVLVYSTYLGGSGGDVGYGVAVDSNKDAYVCGVTNSSNFPTLNGKQTSYGGSGDAFVTELNPSQTKIIYSTFIGGSGGDSAAACTISASDDVYVTGNTSSSDFPIAPASSSSTPAFQTAYGGNGDAFVTEVSSQGNSLLYSSYLGGSGADFGQGIALDSQGNAYVTGSTQSPDLKTANALQPTLGGASDAFVAEINFSGTALVYLTYLGGTQSDTGQAISVDKSGDAYVAGYTFSTDFPTNNPIFGTNAGGSDAFVAELSASTSIAPTPTLLFSTYLGGGGQDQGLGVTLDSSADIFVTGETQSGSSSSSPFPTTPGAYQTTLKGTQNAFVAEITPGSSSSAPKLAYSTYVGGSGTDQANGVAVDSSGDAFVVGFTQSTDFPVATPTQRLLGISGGSSACGTSTCSDAFVSELDPTGTHLLFSTFLGGSGADFGQGISLDSSGDIFVTGSTSSSNFPAIAGAYQATLGGVAGNAFVGQIQSANSPSVAVFPGKVDFGNQTVSVTSSAQTITLVNEGTAPLTISTITLGNTDFKETDNCVGTVAPSGGTCTINVTFTPAATGSVTSQITLTDNAVNSPQNLTLTGSGVTQSSSITLSPTSLTFASQAVGTVSAAQAVTITNTGSSTVNITQISVSGDFQQTNTCGAIKNVLNAGQSCTVTVIFAPTGSGARTGSLSVSDTATGSPQTAALSGTGAAVFSLASTAPTVTSLVGSTSATFSIKASGQSGFTGTITLTCPSATCSFSPASVAPGQTSTLTVSGLSASTPNPYNFTVQGASGSQSTTLALSVQLKDYSLSYTPLLNTIPAGGSAPYKILVTPTFGFNQAVTLSCSAGVPPGAHCAFSSPTVTPNGSSPVSSALTITTTAQSSIWPLWTGKGEPPQWMLILAGAWLALALGLWIKARRSARRPQASATFLPVGAASRAVILAGFLFLLAAFSSCRGVTASAPTPSNGYFITVTGTLQSNTAVTHSVQLPLVVTPTP